MPMTFSPWNPDFDSLVTARDYAGIRALKEADPETEKVWVDFSSMNACDILRLLGIQPSPSGRLACNDLTAIARKVIRSRNVKRLSSSLNRQAASGGGGSYTHWDDCDNTQAQTLSRLERLGEVVDHCIRKGYDLVWG